ncbi:hypothetical protein BKA61DRAFT_577791 [Leptodontidium sp. MPI-SDFR-AT-0119]|nr:hypothetical protein BKA61DRAFT_577791 [Leptodontidium sp. MPI-SDFR-AT-0119]
MCVEMLFSRPRFMKIYQHTVSPANLMFPAVWNKLALLHSVTDPSLFYIPSAGGFLVMPKHMSLILDRRFAYSMMLLVVILLVQTVLLLREAKARSEGWKLENFA